jgi:hypothetical protein
MAFKLSKQQLAQRDALAADLRQQATVLNTAIAAFNRGVAPLAQAVTTATDDYNQMLDTARTLANDIAETARRKFDEKSERWQDGDRGIQIRTWIEQWEMSLDDVELDLPEPLEEIDPDDHAGAIESAAETPAG